MENEKELYLILEGALNARGIPFIHIPNRAFSKKYRTPNNLKHLPDYTFPFGGIVNMWEFGVPGRHEGRKEMQRDMMLSWKHNGGVSMKMIFSVEGLNGAMAEIGLIK